MIDAFFVKKLASVFVHVIPGIPIVLLATLLCRRWSPRLSGGLSIALCLLLVAASVPPVSNYFVSKLENRFPVLQSVPPGTDLILVLGAGHIDSDNRPPNSILSATALSRLVEAVRLWKTQPDAILAVSGAGLYGEISHAEAMKNMAIALGVPNEKIVAFPETRDTASEINTASNYLKNNRSLDLNEQQLVIVSSATHLLRASTMAMHQQVNFSVAPTDYLAGNSPWYRAGSKPLDNLDRVVHEWVGILWHTLAHDR